MWSPEPRVGRIPGPRGFMASALRGAGHGAVCQKKRCRQRRTFNLDSNVWSPRATCKPTKSKLKVVVSHSYENLGLKIAQLTWCSSPSCRHPHGEGFPQLMYLLSSETSVQLRVIGLSNITQLYFSIFEALFKSISLIEWLLFLLFLSKWWHESFSRKAGG